MSDGHENANGERRLNAPTKTGQQLTNGIITILVLAFMAWAGVVWNGTNAIADKLETLSEQIYQYQIRMENRVTTVEERQKRVLDCCGDRQ